jgi:cytochrome c oxidase cbb3-type subunit 3
MSEFENPPPVQLLVGEEQLILDHDYDGIHELNHVLPRWWLGLFYATIVFAAGYAGYYLSGSGPNPRQELVVALRQIEVLKAASAPVTAPSANDKTALFAAFKDPAKIKHGNEVFSAKCVACHGEKAQGVIGPNLTDDYWIHGKGTLVDVATVIASGVPEKGMPPWGPILTADELRDVVAFIHSLHASHPAGAKAAQGDLQEFKD